MLPFDPERYPASQEMEGEGKLVEVSANAMLSWKWSELCLPATRVLGEDQDTSPTGENIIDTRKSRSAIPQPALVD